MSARSDLSKLCGPVSHDEADEMVTRFVASHFNGRMGSTGEHARITIPADPKRDDDLRMSAYVEQQREAERQRLACDHKATWQLERYSSQDECSHTVLWCSGCGALKDGNAWRLPSGAAPNPPKEPA